MSDVKECDACTPFGYDLCGETVVPRLAGLDLGRVS
jgi:hypothetical protein